MVKIALFQPKTVANPPKRIIQTPIWHQKKEEKTDNGFLSPILYCFIADQALTWTVIPALRKRSAMRSNSSLDTFTRFSAGVLRSML